MRKMDLIVNVSYLVIFSLLVIFGDNAIDWKSFSSGAVFILAARAVLKEILRLNKRRNSLRRNVEKVS